MSPSNAPPHDEPRNRPSRTSSGGDIHDSIAHFIKVLGRVGLGEKVGVVVERVNVRDDQLEKKCGTDVVKCCVVNSPP